MRVISMPQIYINIKRLGKDSSVIYKMFQAPLLSINQAHNENNARISDCNYYNHKHWVRYETQQKRSTKIGKNGQ